MSYFVNFNAEHALRNLEYSLKRCQDPNPKYCWDESKIKVYVCAYGYENSKRIFNKPNMPIWAYIVLYNQPLSEVKEAHVREDIVEGNFVECSFEHLRTIATKPYNEQKLPV